MIVLAIVRFNRIIMGIQDFRIDGVSPMKSHEPICVEIDGRQPVTDVKLPADLVSPDDFGHFIEHADFTRVWRERGFDDDDLRNVQAIALIDAANAAPIRDSGGIHECTYVDSRKQKSIRFWFLHFSEVSTIFFILAEDESMDEKLTPEDRRLLQARAAEILEELQAPRRL
jgi:hypothetical protein